MGRYYIDRIRERTRVSLPEDWGKFNDKREIQWTEEREKYGFDSRETWSLNYTFYVWLYERLSMYNEVNVVDTSFHKFEFDGETLTFQEAIDKILVICNNVIVGEDIDVDKNGVVPRLFAEIFGCLWW